MSHSVELIPPEPPQTRRLLAPKRIFERLREEGYTGG